MPAAPPSASEHALIAIAAHELRHPLHLMRLAVARYFPRGDERACVMERYIDRMTRIISDMTDLLRLEHDALALELSQLDLARMLREVVDAYLPDANVRHITLTLDGAADAVWVTADARRLLQVLSNVLDNALKLTPSKGAVAVSMIAGRTELEIRVRDTGSGISPELLPHVFELYAGAASPGGMGIGLTVARHVMRMHGGDILVFSAGAHTGAEVVMTLPSAQLTRADPTP